MSDRETTAEDVLSRLRLGLPERPVSAIGQLHRDAANEIERLRRIEDAAEFLVQNDMAGIVEDSAWTRLRKALGIEVCPI